ncbi:uncharacterized protein LOC122006609 [Zingiber officinale]|uniref:Uncharacterized protein n=1 Tax=Zingiber officinale TaxID=94328 RepID=A0A8J5KN80_ZINOF|nr:uncharacterized protein LOC122006609 [Zingiber officinale]KAG6490636.1 hypothetical protein ZIOFF_051945 [Zingiber officinale]
MSGLTELGFALILILSLFLLGLTAELLYLFFRRRRHPDFADPERAGVSSAGPTHRVLLFHALCLNSKRRSRVEPASAVVPSHAKTTKAEPKEEEEEEESDLARWSAVCLGPSRALYTIKEEEPEEEEEEEGGDDEAQETTPFETPCASLRFESPSPSPPPETAEAVDPAPSGAHRKLEFP